MRKKGLAAHAALSEAIIVQGHEAWFTDLRK
jgi:hypothetical protein